MHVFELRDGFGLDHLQRAEREVPEPGPDQVRVRLYAASLNYRDLLMVRGHYDPRQPLPLVPCSDGVGVIEAIGDEVDQFAVGDRVATLFCQRWQSGEPTRDKLRSTLGGPHDGTLTEAMVLDQDGVVKIPEYLSALEAATLPCAALTAWSALVTYGEVRAGETVLIQGTGGVSLFALQIARAAGARVVITSSKPWKLEKALKMGAEHGIDTSHDADWGRAVRSWTGGRGVDHVVEVGGAGTLSQSLKAVRIGGRIAMIGVLSGARTEIGLTPILMQNVRLQGVLVGSRERFEAMCRAFAAHRILPVVDRVFPFDESREAFAYLASGHHMGKVVIEMPARVESLAAEA